MKKQKGLGLIGILLIIGVLAITVGGVLVWQRRTLPTTTPTPISSEESADQCSGLGEEYCLANSDCTPVYGPSCPACMDEVFKKCRERLPGEVKRAPWGVIDESRFCAADSNCILIEKTACQGGCPNCQMLDLSSPLFDSFNKNLCQKNQPATKTCDHCDIQRTNQENWKAKCINGLCTKVELSGEISPSLTPAPGQQCGTYIRNERREIHCATCGNSICEPFEDCAPSSCTSEACISDCGPLYCKKDCEQINFNLDKTCIFCYT